MKKYDALIIGFGKGGKTLAAALGKKGIKTAVIEKSPLMYGGTCINIGCIPTKKLIHTAADAKKNQQADYSEKNNFYAAAIREKNTLKIKKDMIFLRFHFLKIIYPLFPNLNHFHEILLFFYTNRTNLFFFLINLQYHHRIYQHGQIHNVLLFLL